MNGVEIVSGADVARNVGAAGPGARIRAGLWLCSAPGAGRPALVASDATGPRLRARLRALPAGLPRGPPKDSPGSVSAAETTGATNTERGSSGSPCFTPGWVLTALHHSGDPDFDAGHEAAYNEGVPIGGIVEMMRGHGVGGVLGENGRGE